MRYLPRLQQLKSTREMIGEFRGYNHNLRIRPNEFYDMQNLSSDLYPLVSPRQKRAMVRKLTKPNGLFAHNRLCWVDGTDLYYNGNVVGTVSDSKKQFVGMGAYILIWPDKVMYNTSTGEMEQLENRTESSGTVSVTLCKVDGTEYEDYSASDKAPGEPTDGMLWIDTSSTPHVLKVYSETQGMWASVPTTYVKIAADGIGQGYAEYDGVTIQGVEQEDLNGSFILYATGDNYVVVTGIIDQIFEQETGVVIERKVPDMDFITENNNRLWGCSNDKHEIYACALGDPKNWNRFLGIATDSYALTVGSNGDFTGCISHLGYVLFFKENVIHKIYGNKPSNFQLTDTNCRGVERGSEKSLVIVNETLYYKSVHDVCAYNTALPSSISEELGLVKYNQATAGALGSKYYISMKDRNGTGRIFVYDEAKDLWHKEDNIYASYFADIGNDLYFINELDSCIYSVNGVLDEYAGEDAKLEKQVEWEFQTGDIGLDSPDNKYISKLQVRLEVDEGALLRIEVQYDHETAWEEKYRINMASKQSFVAPVIPRRCDTMRLRFSGYGSFRIYSITKTIEQGSEM